MMLGWRLDLTFMQNGILLSLLYGSCSAVFRQNVTSKKFTNFILFSFVMMRLNSVLKILTRSFLISLALDPLSFSKQVKPLSRCKVIFCLPYFFLEIFLLILETSSYCNTEVQVTVPFNSNIVDTKN